MEREPDNKNGITKARRLSWRITEELERSKEIDENSKRSHEEVI